ncbi:MAG TPA: galactokinase family protein [Erythrobacter sp.]|nr:galactokinase family protein [Erythrobacter sp.]
MDRRERLIARARQGFRLAYGVDPTRFVSAPGRVNLIGDYLGASDGYALPCAIEHDTIIAMGPPSKDAQHPVFEAVAIDMGSARDRFDLVGLVLKGDNNWQNHVRGVVQALGRYGQRVKPMRIAIAGDVPIGAGFSSSAALGVAVALACSDQSGLSLSPEMLARVAQAARQDFVGASGTIMDAMAAAASTAGNALLLDCRTLQHMPIPIHPALVITVIDTGLRRDPSSGALEQRRDECGAAAVHYGVKSLRDLTMDALESRRAGLDERIYARARHVVSEQERVEPVAVALAQGNTAALADLMREAHTSLAQDFEVSLPLIDQLAGLVGAALGTAGGVRLSGSVFGGSLVALCDHAAIPAIDDAVALYNAEADLPARAEQLSACNGAAPITIK